MAAALTAVMILLFIGSWRSTFIIAISIPLSVISSLLILSALGQTINLMTLGGLALAVGILVDDATVEIENVHRQMGMGKPLQQAILDGAQEIALPAFVSTLCICIVFVPMFFLTGVGRYLFVPLAEAVVFAMLASYVLSRTLIPTLVMYFYRNFSYYEHHTQGHGEPQKVAPWLRPFVAIQDRFEAWFTRFRDGYRSLLESIFERRTGFVVFFLVLCVGSCLLILVWARTFSRAWMPGKSGCMSGPAPGRAWRKRPSWSRKSRRPSARKSRPTNSKACWTTSAFPIPASRSVTATTARSARAIRTFSSR